MPPANKPGAKAVAVKTHVSSLAAAKPDSATNYGKPTMPDKVG